MKYTVREYIAFPVAKFAIFLCELIAGDYDDRIKGKIVIDEEE